MFLQQASYSRVFMIVIVMGMSKSGTTLVSKTLHESGINMNPICTGDYNKSKYEDPEIIKILLQMLNVDRLKSLYLPSKIIFNRNIKKQIRNFVKLRSKDKDWGFKQPYITLCYPELRSLLPPHIAIGIKRSFEGLKSHWKKRNKKIDEKKLYYVQNVYNTFMDIYKIPVLSFEEFLANGPVKLSQIIGRKLKDIR